MKCCWICLVAEILTPHILEICTRLRCSPANHNIFLSSARMTVSIYNTDNYFGFCQIVCCRTLLFHTKEDLLNVAQDKITVTNTFTLRCHHWKIEVRGSKSSPKMIFSCCCGLCLRKQQSQNRSTSLQLHVIREINCIKQYRWIPVGHVGSSALTLGCWYLLLFLVHTCSKHQMH